MGHERRVRGVSAPAQGHSDQQLKHAGQEGSALTGSGRAERRDGETLPSTARFGRAHRGRSLTWIRPADRARFRRVLLTLQTPRQPPGPILLPVGPGTGRSRWNGTDTRQREGVAASRRHSLPPRDGSGGETDDRQADVGRIRASREPDQHHPVPAGRTRKNGRSPRQFDAMSRMKMR